MHADSEIALHQRRGVAAMTVIRFPPRHLRAVWILPLRGGVGWLVLNGSAGWLHGSYDAAVADAKWLSSNVGLPIRMGARP
jgi:hypothetical protein